jgi:hypothetical protein
VSSPGQLPAFTALSSLIIGSGGVALIGLGVGIVVTGRRH